MQKILFILLLLQVPVTTDTSQKVPSNADSTQQLTPMEFEEEMLESFREDPAFDYSEREPEENWWTRFKRALLMQWNRLMHWLFGDIQNNGFLQFIVQVLPYLLLLLILALVGYLFHRLNPASSLLSTKRMGEVRLNEEEHIVRNLDIKNLIRKAEDSGDFRLAVRYHFLFVLQQLSVKGYIKYDPAKTDEDYLHELKKEALRTEFKSVNRIYDFIWYGHFETAKATYDRINKIFLQMENMLHEQTI